MANHQLHGSIIANEVGILIKTCMGLWNAFQLPTINASFFFGSTINAAS